jgi:phage terminase large subunit-like protein
MARNVNIYTNAANKYARDVVSDKIPACKWVKLACKRHLQDLKQSKKKNFKWKFDSAKVEKVCKFFSNLVHIKGSLSGQKIILEPWQAFFIGSVFGWVNKTTKFRRFNDAYAEIPRKNGKSVLGAGSGLYLLVADGELGAEIYAGAGSEEQANEVFRPAWLMADQSPGFKDHFGISLGGTIKNPGPIHQEKTNSFFKTVIGKPGDGASVHGGIVDEYHEHKTDELYDTLNTGMGARDQGLMLTITTSGTNLKGPCKKKSDLMKKILDGTVKNDRVFGIIYTIDEENDPENEDKEENEAWKDIENWKKANPNFGISVTEDFLRQQLLTAIQQTNKRNIIRCKHLNQWMSVDSAWMDMLSWNKCKRNDLLFTAMKDLPCIISMDLASKIDLACLVILFWDDSNYYAFTKAYVPRETVKKEENKTYQDWELEERITVTPGFVTDYSYIEDDILDICRDFNVEKVAYDPFQATYIATRLMKKLGDEKVVEVGATVRNFSEPMKEVEKLTLQKKLFHNDPVLDWCISNVVGHYDKKENIFPNKEGDANKIDAAVALIMAMSIAMRIAFPSTSVYETRGVVAL